LDEPSALEYGRRKGYVGQVLNVAGATGPKSSQTLMALAEFHRDPTVAALYGFSGGGYNVLHIIKVLAPRRTRSPSIGCRTWCAEESAQPV